MSTSPASRVLLNDVTAALSAEAAAGMVVGISIAALRDPLLLRARGVATPGELLTADLPSIDRAGARTLVRIAEAFADVDPSDAAQMGIVRLTLLAEAAPALRQRLLSAAPSMTTVDLRRAIRESRIARTTVDPLVATRGTARYEAADAARIAQELIATATRALRDLDASGLRAARSAVRLREAVGVEQANELLAIETGLGRADIERLYRIADHTATVSTELRERIGLRGLRAIASIEGDQERSSVIIWASSEAAIGAEEVVVRARSLSTARVRPHVVAAETPTAPVVLVPYDVLFLTDRASEQERAIDATPQAIVEQLLLRATRPGDTVVDLTAGCGTVATVAARLGRSVVGVDPIDPPLSPTTIVGDARSVEIPGGPFAAAILHPPLYGDRFISERFSGRTQPGDLSVLRAEAYTAAVGEIIARATTLIRPDGEVIIVARAAHADGRFYDWPARFAAAAEAAGMVAVDRMTVIEAPEERLERERLELGRAVREGRSIPVTLSALRFRLPTAADRRRR